MTDVFDDGEGSSVRTRLERFLRESREAGIPWDKARIVAAVSVNESGAIFRRRRRTDLALLDVACDPVRQILALELGNPMLGTYLPETWLSDHEVMTYVNDHGWLDTNGKQLTREFAAGDTPSSPNEEMPRLFDWLIDHRKGPALGVFSVGPTQVFLKYSPLAGGSYATRFPTWENLWSFWTAKTAAEQWKTGVWDYLFTAPQLAPSPQVCRGNSPGCIENWLEAHQTGTRDWSIGGKWANYADQFQSHVALVSSLRATVGY